MQNILEKKNATHISPLKEPLLSTYFRFIFSFKCSSMLFKINVIDWLKGSLSVICFFFRVNNKLENRLDGINHIMYGKYETIACKPRKIETH